ncbi:hypothetical protein SNOG_04913 [Parastagonospora nodorum SN15]|uniref:Uncharacterized protein n=1 Tax=Phaeosphaeria nodorum (strain SN15 / ATCC MYA-4574 / FGSC 10173) TaxID=321614 RepID=Q0UTK1_PHANO|nr:hypothetical protein SNOG_04913 [Parastagonospora nodorum SN15]EAT87304.1 hypothetical protein SNOG_04913 [Parastagonospora nodorum SN15]
MKLSTLILLIVVFGVSAYSYPPPFNEFRYLDNVTLLHEAIAQHRPVHPRLGSIHGHQDRRWSHADHGLSPMDVWPVNDNKFTVVPFCYVNKFAKNRTGRIWSQAWKVKDATGAAMFCYTDYTREMWNPSVKPTTLAIGLFIDAMHATATAGFTHPDW